MLANGRNMGQCQATDPTVQQRQLPATSSLGPSPGQALTLLLMGTFIDSQFNEISFDSLRSMAACAVLALSCLLAVGVNLSQFLCLGRFSALSFQVCAGLPTPAMLSSDCG